MTTMSDFGLRNWRASIVKAIWIAIGLVIMISFKWHEMVVDRLGGAWASILAFFILFIAVFLWNFLAAPRQIQAETDESVVALQGQLDNREARQAAIDELWLLRSIGISLRNESVNTPVEFADWERRYRAWRNDTLSAARQVSVNLHNWLEHLDRTVPNPAGLSFLSGTDHERFARIASTILYRLQMYLERELWNGAR